MDIQEGSLSNLIWPMQGQWINAGANLPLAVSRGVSLEYGHDAFLAIGGVVGSGLSAENRVYKFNVANMNWEQVEN